VARLGAPADAFRRAGAVFVPTPSEQVVVVSVGRGAVVLGPPRVRAALLGLDPSAALDGTTVTERLLPFGARLEGEATLMYLSAERFCPCSGRVRPATPVDVAEVLDRSSPADVDESSLDGTAESVVALAAGDQPVSLARLAVWDDEVAQLSVLTVPGHRRGGHAAVAASAVVVSALQRGLIPQWRVRVGHLASESLARQALIVLPDVRRGVID